MSDLRTSTPGNRVVPVTDPDHAGPPVANVYETASVHYWRL